MVQSVISSKKSHLSSFDLLRVLCALIVCGFHTVVHLKCNYGILQPLFRMGAICMTAFFLLSGFSLYLNYHPVDLINLSQLKNYLFKRCLSILPMYYVASLIYIVFIDAENFLQNILLFPIESLAIQSIFSTLFSVTHNGGTWFISCIMFCYIVYPFIQSIVNQLNTKNKLCFIGAFSFILLYAPIIVIQFDIQNIYSNPFFRILEFSIGILLASLRENLLHSPRAKKYIFSWKTILFSFLVLWLGLTLAVNSKFHIGDYMLYNWIALPCFAIILFSLSGINSHTLNQSRKLHYLSRMSYSFFLAQLYSNVICKKIIAYYSISSNLCRIILGWGVCIIIAIVLHELIEKRLIQAMKSALIR